MCLLSPVTRLDDEDILSPHRLLDVHVSFVAGVLTDISPTELNVNTPVGNGRREERGAGRKRERKVNTGEELH